MEFEEAADGLPTGYFVAVLKHRDYQWALVPALEVDQCRPLEVLVKRRCRALEYAFRQVVKLYEVQRKHMMEAKIQAMKYRRKSKLEIYRADPKFGG